MLTSRCSLLWYATDEDRAGQHFYAPISTVLSGSTDFNKLKRMKDEEKEEEEEEEELEESKADAWGLGRATSSKSGAHVSETEAEESSNDSHTEAEDDPEFFENGIKEEQVSQGSAKLGVEVDEVKSGMGDEVKAEMKEEDPGSATVSLMSMF